MNAPVDIGTERHLDPGDTLFEAGDEGLSVYFLQAGTLDVFHQGPDSEIIIRTLEPGEVVGEIAAMIGGSRTATIRAGDTPVVLHELTADEFGEWINKHPDSAAELATEARDRMDRTRVVQVLTDLIGPGHAQVIDDTNELLDWVRLPAGQQLFDQGDEADAAYIIVSGRLRLVAKTGGPDPELDITVGRGDIIGEFGVIERSPRTARAVAIRDTTLARFSIEAFETLTARHPALMLQLFRKILTRVMRPTPTTVNTGRIAVAVLDPACGSSYVAAIAEEMALHGPALHLDRSHVHRFFDRRGLADAPAGSLEHARLDEFLHQVDIANQWVVLETDSELTEWTRRALRSADKILVITPPFPDPQTFARIEEFATEAARASETDVWMIQANSSAVRHPTLNRSVVDAIGPERVLQLRRGDRSSLSRIARLASGTATGVALSGGGGRGLAHIGALRALTDSGIAIDAIAGTSMGSIVAASMAFKEDPIGVLEQLTEAFEGTKIVDYTLPIVSLSSGRLLTAAIDDLCGPALIEELWMPFSCISTNLTRAQKVVHQRGNLSHGLRASVSLPGVFPPVVSNGELLVDGGVLENLPVGPLAQDPGIATVIAIDVAPPTGPAAKPARESDPNRPRSWRADFSRRQSGLPPVATTVMSSMLLGSSQARVAALEGDLVDLYVSLNLRGVKLLDFEDLTTVAQRGYDAALEPVQEWVAGRSAPC